MQDFFSVEDAKQSSGLNAAVNPEITMMMSPEQQAALLAEQSEQKTPKDLDDQVSVLTRQLIQLQQQLTDQYDQLRGQVAAIHLSHSGLIKNLRERVETLEDPPA
ncbi:MAG: hypothetical protein HC810_04320 [Acaryochloridaceae cyanobacterium RL_2_7]|nr:hypothetical protein [Acaryochloridaceae cyanobacterium RL_2_7]